MHPTLFEWTVTGWAWYRLLRWLWIWAVSATWFRSSHAEALHHSRAWTTQTELLICVMKCCSYKKSKQFSKFLLWSLQIIVCVVLRQQKLHITATLWKWTRDVLMRFAINSIVLRHKMRILHASIETISSVIQIGLHFWWVHSFLDSSSTETSSNAANFSFDNWLKRNGHYLLSMTWSVH